jgi:flagellar protein FlaG
MTRIDANLATQVGDASRPAQSVLVAEDQKVEAQRSLNQSSEPRPLIAAKPDEVKAAAERLQQVIEVATGRSLDFTVNDRFKELVVVISDRRSGETIKEIPSKDLMKLRERINDLIGMFIDEKA